ncbi:MAG: SGNH/GDSL hydrolase family protein, partial [Bacteroidota bacterium]|nr:SGNH/GDSL hydrolase family protein [Bacteroidota bacterium]
LYCLMDNKWIFIGNGKPDTSSNANIIFANKNKAQKEYHYILFLPLYNGVRDLKIGISNNSSLKKDSIFESKKPIVFYGTSITQGGCASRPGNCHTSLLLRHLNRPVINLGFSGNGKMEPEMIQLISELDASLYIIDCHKNMKVEEVKERMEPAIRELRIKHSDTPIMVIEETNINNIYPSERGIITTGIIKKLIKEGFTKLYYLPGNNLLGHDSEGTVDTIHPNDLGFSRFAVEIEKFIKQNKILK